MLKKKNSFVHAQKKITKKNCQITSTHKTTHKYKWVLDISSTSECFEALKKLGKPCDIIWTEWQKSRMFLSGKIFQKATAEYHSIQLSGAMGGVKIIGFWKKNVLIRWMNRILYVQ